MTTRGVCRALYHSLLDRSATYNPPGVSGPENSDPSGGSGPRIGDSNGNEFNRPIDSHEDAEPHHIDTDPADSGPGAALTETLDENHAHQDGTPIVERFPLGLAGAPISDVGQSTAGGQAPYLGTEGIWSPFRSQRDWDFA
ncbi:hypothetical protein EDB89DRAFT_1905591 [Lactarius sanguifluus]|nr:hypothetical protein EDB89DRAFT_1905591 [Lactarius sanguifluus]